MQEVGTIYLLCFSRPLGHASHYMGWTTDLNGRLDDHVAGRGSALMRAVKNQGIAWTVSRKWRGTRTVERRLKNLGSKVRLCPICTPGTTWGNFDGDNNCDTAPRRRGRACSVR